MPGHRNGVCGCQGRSHIGKLPADEMPHERFVKPVSAADLYGVEVHRERRTFHGVPVSGGFDRPFVRDRDFRSEVERSGKSREGIALTAKICAAAPRGLPHSAANSKTVVINIRCFFIIVFSVRELLQFIFDHSVPRDRSVGCHRVFLDGNIVTALQVEIDIARTS